MRQLALPCLVALSLALASCGESEPGAQTAAPPAGGATQPAAWLLASAPEGAMGVTEAKAAAAEGEEIVLRGRIGGRRDAIGEDGSTFVVMDSSIPSCADEPEESCPTPWDYCCEPKEVKEASSATVQLVDEAGRPVEGGLPAAGIEPLDEVIVVGTVGARPSPAVLVVKAKALHRVGG